MQIKCLIVEDAQFMLEIYRYALAAQSHVEIVGEASDGEEAIRMLSELKPDVVLLDLVLPLKSGLDVLKEISIVSPQTKIIVVSSIDDEKIVTKAKALGALIYIKKPFTKADLLKAFDEAGKSYSEVENG
jgi:two-component system chemotaxis response regulator CheY